MAGTGDKKGFHRPFDGLAALKERVPPAPGKTKLGLKPKAAPPPPPAPAPARTDEELFLDEIAGTQRLDRRGPRVGAPPAAKAKPRLNDDAEVLAQLADLCDGGGSFDFADTDEYIEGVAEGIDRRILKRLRNGEFAVQAHIDLHGLTREEAKERVLRFVAESRKAGLRCVLLVTGRGLHSKDQIPILKQAVRTWLERGQLARAVLAFATARPADGGAGAVYVLLRR